MHIAEFVHQQRRFSSEAFGPGARTKGVTEHIAKELEEIRADPHDLMEWVDVILLAMDGAWRAGYTPNEVETAMREKLRINQARKWPDWRTAGDGAITHLSHDQD